MSVTIPSPSFASQHVENSRSPDSSGNSGGVLSQVAAHAESIPPHLAYFSEHMTATTSTISILVQEAGAFARHVTGYGLHSPTVFGSVALESLFSNRILDQLGEQFLRLSRLAQLPVGWDGDDATPLGDEVITRTAELVINVALNTLRAPVLIAPLTDGSIQVEWSDGQKRLELVIEDQEALTADLITDVSGPNRQFTELGTVDEDTVQRIVSEFVG